MNIVICSSGYSGYSAACWRKLAGRPGVKLAIYSPPTAYGYGAEILNGLPVTILEEKESGCGERLVDAVLAARPDILFISGWSDPLFRKLASSPRLKGIRKVMCVDTMWNGSLRQIGARWVLASYRRHFDGIMVAGDRGRRFASWLGFPGDRIFTSTYGYDANAFADCFQRRMAKEWPRSFCFVGRYAPVKGLHTLMEAYRQYRGMVEDAPWELHCYGKGDLQEELSRLEGGVDHGFIQPKELPEALVRHGAFVFPSLHEPWGVALAEAAGAGLPLLCSDHCASGVDLVRHLYNGYVFPAGNADRLAQGLSWLHRNHARLPEMGRVSRIYAGAYSPASWADRVLDIWNVLKQEGR